jgi:predicted amidohydrolase YtcJ
MIDRILYNGNIITLDDAKQRVSALAIHGDTIVACGADDDILPLANPRTIKEDLQGKTIIPGLTDAHIHWWWTAKALNDIDIFEAPSKQIVLERVAERVSTLSPGEWITGHGWLQDIWSDRQFPTADDLDSVAPDNPVYLSAKSGHAAWANSAALLLSGISKDTPDPTGGQLGRDSNETPDGILFETAMDLVSEHVPNPSAEQVAQLMKETQKQALAAGLTGIHDLDGPDCLKALQIMREHGDLQIRVLKNVNDYWMDDVLGAGVRWGFGDDWLRIGGIKLFADGALGAMTGLMVEPYEGQPDNRGIAVRTKDEMLEIVSKASAAGFPCAIHAIGDMAIRNVLDVYETVRKEEVARGELPETRRHRIEHLQIMCPDDLNRLAEMKIIASMQPIHATSDYVMAQEYWGERCQWAYNARLQIDKGVTVAFGSDSPVEPFEPFKGIHAAVTRRRPDGSPGEDGWYPELRLTVEEALRGFTVGPAYAAGMEDRLGKLAPGYLADLVVLDRDLYDIPHHELPDMGIVATMVGGEWRFGEV